MPSRAAAHAALRRDERLAASHTRGVQQTFRAERDDVLRAVEGGDPILAVDPERWRERLAVIWIAAAEAVYNDHVERLTGAKQAFQSQLTALVQQIIRRGAPATQVQQFIDDMADGVVTTSRRRIHTILREAGPPANVRDVSRALRRLYNTDFVETRAARIALDQVLRATVTFEDAAARQVAASTGREYRKRWVTQGDAFVRESHARAEGNNANVHLDDLFKVGATLLRYPRDPAGPVEETVNCRCWVEHFVATGG